MQFTTALLASAAAMTASALPQATPIADGTPFGIITIRSGSQVQNSALQAANSGLLVNANSQNASCDAETNSATFYIKDEELHLLESKSSARPQQIFVDRSWFGQGAIGYVTGAQPIGERSETKGWALVNGELQFQNTGLQVCPGSVDGAWSVWLQGLDKPGSNENCTAVSNLAIKADKPIGCWYS